MRLLPAVILAVAVVLAPVVWLVGSYVLSSGDGLDGPAVDSGARIEIEVLRQQMESLQNRVGTVEEELSRLQRAPADPFAAEPQDPNAPFERLGENQIADSYAQVVLIAGRRSINTSLSVPTASLLLE
ncbi:MAG: M15 family peptidase, partial [Paracoccaceae bacterium]|nr:M15 family peptidase [Paracoccaceae bacterium]